MNRFRELLYFADRMTEPGPALRRAVALAAANAARLTVFDVVPDGPERAGTPGGPGTGRRTREEREAHLDALLGALGETGGRIVRRVVTGVPAAEVIRAVIDHGHDLVVKAARAPDSFATRTLCAADLHLLRRCPCPVWIDREDAATPYRTVLAAVDPADRGPDEAARMVMDLALATAAREEARLAVVQAWCIEGADRPGGGRGDVPSDELEALYEETRARCRERLGDLLGGYGMAAGDAGVHLIEGEPAPTIRALCRELGADLVVMGTPVRRGVPGLLIASAAEDLLQTTRASVLAIKPRDFAAPATVAGNDGKAQAA